MFNNIAMQLDTNWRIRYGQDAKPNRSPMENAAQKCCKVHKQNTIPNFQNRTQVTPMVLK
jgi:hypothetical protein